MKATRIALVTAIAAIALATAASAAAAGTVTINTFFGCPGGIRVVPADSTIVLRLGWLASTRGLAQSFEIANTTVLAIDGAPRADADDASYLTLVAGPDGWTSRWNYPTGITLAAGDSFAYSFDWLLSHQLHDGIVTDDDRDQSPTFAGPGSAFGGPLNCTVVAA